MVAKEFALDHAGSSSHRRTVGLAVPTVAHWLRIWHVKMVHVEAIVRSARGMSGMNARRPVDRVFSSVSVQSPCMPLLVATLVLRCPRREAVILRLVLLIVSCPSTATGRFARRPAAQVRKFDLDML